MQDEKAGKANRRQMKCSKKFQARGTLSVRQNPMQEILSSLE